MSGTLTLLVDNGSLEPAATLKLRALARALSARIGAEVAPVSLLHASAVPPDKIEGVPAEILEPALARRAEEGARGGLDRADALFRVGRAPWCPEIF